jgi:hypothetical protein
MERGLIWLPLLALFFWLTWAGWNEYRKVEAYRLWAEKFDRAKYDIYAVLGQQGDQLTWGKPTRQGMIDLETFSLKDVQTIRLRVDDRLVDLHNPPTKGRAMVEFLRGDRPAISIPFTEPAMAAEWTEYLQRAIAP